MAENDTEICSGIFDGPVTDTLGVSVSGSFRDSDGYYDNDYVVPLPNPGSAPNASTWTTSRAGTWPAGPSGSRPTS